MKVKQKRKFNFSLTLLWSLIVLSFTYLTFLTLGALNVVELTQNSSFNYIIAYILTAVCLLLCFLLLFIEYKKSFTIPLWLKNIIYIAVFVFTNVYYFFGLYSTIIGLIVFYAILAFIINILSLAIFFHTQRNQNNATKNSTSFVTLSTFAYAVAFSAILQTIVSAIKVLINSTAFYSSLSMLIIEMCTIILVSIIMAIMFTLSLNKTKKFINNCLIRYNNK